MIYTLWTPTIRYDKVREIDLPDNIDPNSIPLGPGQRMTDNEGITRATGPELEEALSTIAAMLDDVKELVLDIGEIHP